MQNDVYRFRALATDYDGTLAHNGRVSSRTIAALKRVRASGRRLVLVTGRELEQLMHIFPEVALFDLVVAENGALLYWPETDKVKVLADPPQESFVRRLKEASVTPLSVGHVIVATFEPFETVVLKAIKDLGLELEVIFNKGAVMVLPTGINKATGLRAGLASLGISPRNVVGVGDAQNDHAFLDVCGCGVAVQNALPSLKEHAHIVTQGDHGDGVVELIDELLATDLESAPRDP
jgi:HAD superfamily hydrolase (TIGR01484 family)